MNSNNYATSFNFTQPPPNYKASSLYNYNWQQLNQNAKNAPNISTPSAPPLPPGPPPAALPLPPPPPPPPSSHTPPFPNTNTSNLEQRSPTKYNNSTQLAYRRKSGQYASPSGQYSAPPGQYSSPSGQYPPSPGQFPTPSGQYASSSGYHSSSSSQYSSSSSQYSSSSGQYSPSARQFPTPGQYPSSRQYPSSADHYSSASAQFNSSSGYSNTPAYNNTLGQYNANSSTLYGTNNSQNYQRSFYNKRRADSESDNLKKSNRKKKKPLSQNVPQRKDWSVEDAKKALLVEKDYNKRHKSQSLIIKFPDIDLNRDIVSKFHLAIDSVHFQQPSTPRFCFVTLKESIDPETVIRDLNKIPFGQGYLTAEFKKDREDEINIGPEDIDPLTLYVGNLAQEVTKDDMVNTYPRQKRIDIGYAKKMKYTRYAFVSFKNVEDSIQAFRKTHSTQMYSKSLIVRFRRLNGTVGMPGEPKPQPPQRNELGEAVNDTHVTSNGDHNDTDSHNHSSDLESESCPTPSLPPWEMVDVSQWESESNRSFDVNSIKQEPDDDSDYEEEDKLYQKPKLRPTALVPGDPNLAFSMHRPKILPEIKKENDCKEISSEYLDKCSVNGGTLTSGIKEANNGDTMDRTIVKSEDSSDCVPICPDRIKPEVKSVFSEGTYNALRLKYPTPLGSSSVLTEVKQEHPQVDEMPDEQSQTVVNEPDKEFTSDTTGMVVTIKGEPIDGDDEMNDGDQDDSSDDDFNFSNILSSINARSKHQKKLKKSVP